MNDSHIVSLLYCVEHGESVSYEKAEPLVRDEPAFRLEIKDGQVRFELKDHYATEVEAREAIEDYIRVWEFDGCLEKGPDSFGLRFQKAEIVARNLSPGATRFSAELTARGYGSSKLTIGLRNYPSPPSDFSLLGLYDPDVRTMFERYMNYSRKHEPLPGAVYFCLTMLEYMVKNTKGNNESKRKAVSRYFQIDKKVLGEIGRLSSTKGGPSGARKATSVATNLTKNERHFLKEAVKKMIRRAAEKAHRPDADLPNISLTDLPPI